MIRRRVSLRRPAFARSATAERFVSLLVGAIPGRDMPRRVRTVAARGQTLALRPVPVPVARGGLRRAAG
jgi:hypothetical protein